MPRILIIDDDHDTCSFMTELLSQPGREIVSSYDPSDAAARIRRERFDLIVSDINLNAQASGLDLLRQFKAEQPDGQVVLISGFGTLETAIEAVRAGAFDYVSKPFNIGEIKATVDRALAQAAEAGVPLAPPTRQTAEGLLGSSAPMLDVYKHIARAADSSVPVLIQGESGTGKELVARAIHGHGRRAAKPFVAVNCGAIAETLLDSELFGHARGAFTGAIADRRGLFEQARDGTIFLDEISETSPGLQVKLLRVLEESEVRPVGGSRAITVSARIMAATNVDLDREVAAQRFRQDLFYRLSVVVIVVPPLRERRSDIPLLVSRFMERASARAGRRVEIAPDAVEALAAYQWPGNVRELENTIERLVLFSRASRIEVADLPPPIQSRGPRLEEGLFTDLPSLDELERRYLLHVLEAVDGNRSRAAAVMGVDRRTFYRMAERFGVVLKE